MRLERLNNYECFLSVLSNSWATMFVLTPENQGSGGVVLPEHSPLFQGHFTGLITLPPILRSFTVFPHIPALQKSISL